MKELNYVFIDGTSLLFSLNNNEKYIETITTQIKNFIDYSSISHIENLEVLLFLPPKKITRLTQYHQLMNDYIIELQNKYPKYDFSLTNQSLQKIEGSLLSDIDKAIYRICYNLNQLDDENQNYLTQSYSNEERHQLFLLIKSLFPNSTRLRVMGLKKDHVENPIWNYHLDDIIFSCITYMHNICQSKGIFLNINILTNNRALSLGQLKFANQEYLNVDYYRLVKNKVSGKTQYFTEKFNNQLILSYLTDLYEFDFKSGAIGLYLNKKISLNDNIELFNALEEYVKLIEIVDSGFAFNKQGKKQKLGLQRFGLKKLNELCINYISPAHLISIYDDLPDKNKKIFKEELIILNQIMEINRSVDLDKTMIAEFLKRDKQ